MVPFLFYLHDVILSTFEAILGSVVVLSNDTQQLLGRADFHIKTS